MFLIEKNNTRKKQKEALIFRKISEFLYRLHGELSLLDKITIVSVNMSSDSSSANVMLFSDDGETVVKEFIQQLVPFIPSIRKSLATSINLRRTPRIRFIYDSHFSKILKIEKLIDSVKEDSTEKAD